MHPAPSSPRAPFVAAACFVLALGVAREGSAQQLGWRTTIEASGNILFGASRERLMAARGETGRADSTLQVRADAGVTYGDGVRGENDDRIVTARILRSSLALDYRPFARFSPFAFGSAESSLQQRIAGRYAGGAGGKYTVWRRRDDDASLSLAMLGEPTRALRPDSATPPVTNLVRLSLRGRLRYRFTPNLRLSHTTFYQPVVDEVDRYTTDSMTSLEIRVSTRTQVTATLHDKFDSEARRRGARSGHDGQVLFGIRTTF